MSTDAEGLLVSLHEASRRIEALTAERDEARALNNRIVCVWCGWLGNRTPAENAADLLMGHVATCEKRPEARLAADLASARADALAYAIEAGRLEKALRDSAWYGTENDPCWCNNHGAPADHHSPTCRAFAAALTPAAPGDVSVREWLYALAEAGWKAGTGFEPIRGMLLARVDAALSSAPSPSPAARLRVDAGEKAIEAVRAQAAHAECVRKVARIHGAHGTVDGALALEIAAASRTAGESLMAAYAALKEVP